MFTFKKDMVDWKALYKNVYENFNAMSVAKTALEDRVTSLEAELDGYKTRRGEHVEVDFTTINVISLERHHIAMFNRIGTEMMYFKLGADAAADTYSIVFDTSEVEHARLMKSFRAYKEKKANG
jgi:hypothetical protein